jgi:hypothetical protein
MKSLKSIAVFLMLGASFSCHAGNESILEMSYAPGQLAESANVQPVDCKLHFSLPVDARRNKDTLGTTFRDNPIMSKGPMTEWLSSALGNMTRLGFAAVVSDAAAPQGQNGIQIATTLDKIYIWNHSLNLHSTMVVRAVMKKDNGPEIRKSYRVLSTKLNWANGDGEFMETMNLAANRLLLQMADDARSLCTSAGKTT